MDKLLRKYERTPIKSEIASLSPIKVTLDDVLITYLRTEMQYKQDFMVTDARIVIGLVSTGLAILLTYLSLNKEFKEYKIMACYILAAYFLINGIAEILIRIVNKGSVFKGRNENGFINVVTNIGAPDTNYVVMVYKDDKVIPEKYNNNVCDLFDEDGMLLHEIYLKEIDAFFKDGKKNK